VDLKFESSSSTSNSTVTGKQTVPSTSPETFAQVTSVSNCATDQTTVTECSEMHETIEIESQELTCRAHFLLHDFT